MANLWRQHLPGFVATLMKISHPDLDGPLYFTDNNADLTYDGQVYKTTFFKIKMPEQSENSMGNAQLTIGTVDQQLIEIIRSIKTPVTVSFICTYYEDSDTYVPLEGDYDMFLKNVSWNARAATGDLVLDSILDLQFPSSEFNPHNTNGIAV